VNVLALVCTLKPSPEPSSADRFADVLLAAFPKAATDKVRLADVGVERGLQHDMGGADGWPAVKAKVEAADVLVLVTPIWNGQPSSYFLQVGERLNAVLAESDEQHRTPLYGKVAVLGVVGNEDGAHHVGGIGMAMLADLGLSFGRPASPTIWVRSSSNRTRSLSSSATWQRSPAPTPPTWPLCSPGRPTRACRGPAGGRPALRLPARGPSA